VTALWLMPFQPSPGRDGGYDITDYYNVDPKYGTLGDFVEFTHGCEQRGMRVLIDLVGNHTSDSTRGFVKLGETLIRSTGSGMYGRKKNRSTPMRALSFRVCRNQPGLAITPQSAGTSIVFMIFNLI